MLNEQEVSLRILESIQKLISEHSSCIEPHYLHFSDNKLFMNHSLASASCDELVMRIGVPSQGYTAKEYDAFVYKISGRWKREVKPPDFIRYREPYALYEDINPLE
jgi:hypothetical protein